MGCPRALAAPAPAPDQLAGTARVIPAVVVVSVLQQQRCQVKASIALRRYAADQPAAVAALVFVVGLLLETAHVHGCDLLCVALMDAADQEASAHTHGLLGTRYKASKALATAPTCWIAT